MRKMHEVYCNFSSFLNKEPGILSVYVARQEDDRGGGGQEGWCWPAWSDGSEWLCLGLSPSLFGH